MFVYGNYPIILLSLGVDLFTHCIYERDISENCEQFGSTSPVFDLQHGEQTKDKRLSVSCVGSLQQSR